MENLASIITAGIEIILALINGIIDAIPQLVSMIPEIIVAIVQALLLAMPQIVDSGFELIGALGKGLMDAVPSLLMLIPQIVIQLAQTLYNQKDVLLNSGFEMVMQISEGVKEKISEAITWGKDLIANFINGIKSKIGDLKSVVSSIGAAIKSMIGFSEPSDGPLANFHTYAPDMMELFAQGIRDNENLVTDQLADSFDFGTFPQMEVAGMGGMRYNESADDGGDIITAISDALMNMQLVVNIGNKPIEAMITTAQQKTNYRSGGR